MTPICIVGPTGVGKSDFAQLLALEIKANILSCDSMQIYKGMDIGTGKVLPQDRKVTHFGLDIVDPGVAYSVSEFQAYARAVLQTADLNQQRLILCGGTGFWIRAVLDDYQFPQGDQLHNETRNAWNEYLKTHSKEDLWNQLHLIDPKSAQCIHPNNTKRIIRAFEMLDGGIHYSDQLANLQQLPEYRHGIWIGLNCDRDILYRRINNRVDAMIDAGLIDEVKYLLTCGFKEALTAPQAIGYKEIVAYLDNQITLTEAIEQIKQATRRYAKRQISWFKNDKRVLWLNTGDSQTQNLNTVLKLIKDA